MKSMPLFKVTGANGTTAKQAGAPGTPSSLPRLIKYTTITVPLIISLEALRSIYILNIKNLNRPLVLRGHVTNASFKQ